MTNYRRNRVKGGTYFFTVNVFERKKGLLVTYIEYLKAALRKEIQRAPFEILGFVVLPDHLHAVLRLPVGDADYSNRWRRIKAGFTRKIPREESVSPSRRAKGERGIWQRRFWEHTIRDDADLQNHLDYIHYNPVKHGYVSQVIDWPHSTFHKYVEKRKYDKKWGSDITLIDGDFGE